MDFVHVKYDDRYWSKVLHSAIPIPPVIRPQGQDHGLRIFKLKFYVKVFRTSLFPNPLMFGLCMVLYEDIYI